MRTRKEKQMGNDINNWVDTELTNTSLDLLVTDELLYLFNKPLNTILMRDGYIKGNLRNCNGRALIMFKRDDAYGLVTCTIAMGLIVDSFLIAQGNFVKIKNSFEAIVGFCTIVDNRGIPTYQAV